MRWNLRCLLVMLALSPVLCPAVRAQESPDTVYHLHGSVVNGVTGKGIGRALVNSADRRLATLTDSEGNWAIDVSVPAQALATQAGNAPGVVTVGVGANTLRSPMQGFGAGLNLQAQRPGYLPFEEMLSVPLDGTAAESPIVLRLLPEGSVRGNLDTAGQVPPRGIQVLLMHRGVSDGRYAWTQAGAKTVGPDGAFRFVGLQPGEYTVMVHPAGRGGSPQADASEQYPAVYLGGAATLDGATHLRVGYGQAVQADLHVRPVPFYAVEVPVQGVAPNGAISVRVLRKNEGNSGYALRWNAHDGKAQGTLPNGDYTVLVTGLGPVRGSAAVPVHVAGAPVQMAAVALAPVAEIPVHVRDERTGRANSGGNVGVVGNVGGTNQGYSLFVRPLDASSGLPGGGISTRDGNSYVEGLAPGQYVVQAMGWRGYVASVTSGRVDLLREPLTVNATGADPIEVTLRDDSGTVSGTLDAATNGAVAQVPRGVVVLIAESGEQRVPQPAMVKGDGAFTLSNVPPGSYRAMALAITGLRNGGLPYRDADAMRAYDGQSVPVTVSAGQTTTIQLPAPSTVQAEQP